MTCKSTRDATCNLILACGIGITLLALGASSAAQTVSVTPSTLAFASQAVGTTTAAKTVTVKNTGKTTLNITSVVGSGEFAFTSTCSSTLAAGASCTLSVTSTPETVGTIDGAITLTDSATIPTQVISLTGKGLAPVTLSPSTITFGSTAIGTTAKAKTVTLTNSNAALTMGTVTASGDFAVSATTCTGTIAASKTCTISVTFTPSNPGTISGTLSVPTAVWAAHRRLLSAGRERAASRTR